MNYTKYSQLIQYKSALYGIILIISYSHISSATSMTTHTNKPSTHPWHEIFFIFLLSLPPVLWLKGQEVFIGHDSGARLTGLWQLVEIFYSWNPLVNLGMDYSIYKGFLLAK